MKVKRYEGRNIQEVVAKIKLDLGPEATILYVKEFVSKRFWFQSGIKRLEVIAGIQEHRPVIDNLKLEVIHNELKELKDAFRTINTGFGSGMISSQDSVLHPVLREWKAKLLEMGVEEEVALNILEDFQDKFTEKDLKNDLILEENLIKHISRSIEVSGPLVANNHKIIAFVGPTGVGKTTTVAKLMAHFSLVECKRVCLITIDTYRIAAVDQLKTYAEIIGIPIEVVFNPQELLVAVNNHKDKDLILIDTAGSNPFDSVRMEDLKRFLGTTPNIETHLLISMTTKSRELLEIFNCYNIMKIHKLILTKVDEAVTYGNILNLCVKINRPISYITVGQNVPEDIEIADDVKLARMALKGREAGSINKVLEKTGK